MAKFNIGDIICKDETSVPYTVTDIDEISGPAIKYELTQGNFKFWDYCIGWKKLVTADEVLNKGKLLTYDSFNENHPWDSNVYTEISTILYDNRIFYIKQVDYEVVEFKELTR